jgi:hypothetical protein
MNEISQPLQNASPIRRRGSFVFLLAMAVVWLSIVTTAMALIFQHVNAPGTVGEIPSNWPAGTQIALDKNRPTLIMFAHPHCPCTRATLGELDLLMAKCQGKVSAQVWFIKPAGTTADWTNSDLWHSAVKIQGVTAHWDENGVETERFHAETSGQVVLYNPQGRLIFRGGITIARGHSGDNAGRTELMTMLQGRAIVEAKDATPVYGCALFSTECKEPDTK